MVLLLPISLQSIGWAVRWLVSLIFLYFQQVISLILVFHLCIEPTKTQSHNKELSCPPCFICVQARSCESFRRFPHTPQPLGKVFSGFGQFPLSWNSSASGLLWDLNENTSKVHITGLDSHLGLKMSANYQYCSCSFTMMLRCRKTQAFGQGFF